jgi:ribosome-associated protein
MTTDWVSREDDVHAVVNALETHKAADIVVLDLRSLRAGATDFFIVASGASDTHVRALGERVLAALSADGRRPHHTEGLSEGRWVLLDYVDFVVHVFHPTLRRFYQLERLWGEAPSAMIESHG